MSFTMPKRKSVLITGATSGVGHALAKKLLDEGYEVVATGRSVEVLQQLQTAGAYTIAADMTQVENLDMLLGRIETPDIVIVSAGVGTFGLSHELSDEAIRNMMDVNVIAPMKLTKRLLPGMMKRKSGHFIFIGSQAGKVSTPKASAYAASKHAILGYADAVRMEVAPFGIHVTTINPGPIDTPFLDLADATGSYRTSLKKHLLAVDTVVDAVVRVIERPTREVDLPWYMGITSKLHALFPAFVERVGKQFFLKK